MPPVVIGAGIAAVGTIGGAIVAGNAQKKAASTAAQTAQTTTDANNQLFRENKAENIAIASPFYNNGVAAGNALQSLLLDPYNPGSYTGGAPAAATAPTAAPAQPQGALSGYQTSPGYRDGAAPYATGGGVDYGGGDYGGGGRLQYDSPRSPGDNGYAAYYGAPTVQGASAANPVNTAAPAGGTPSALDAFARFRQGTNYQWRLNQGMNALTGQYATRGALDSGAAEKAKLEFGQNFASNELSNYMNLLANQQQVGLSAGNAIMGVSTSATNAIAGQNTAAGNAAANAALIGGQANANLWGTVANTAGQLGGALFQYGMQPKPAAWTPANLGASAPVSFGSVTPVASAPSSYGALSNWSGF